MYTCPNVRAFVTLQHRDNQSTNDTFPSPELYQKKERPLKQYTNVVPGRAIMIVGLVLLAFSISAATKNFPWASTFTSSIQGSYHKTTAATINKNNKGSDHITTAANISWTNTSAYIQTRNVSYITFISTRTDDTRIYHNGSDHIQHLGAVTISQLQRSYTITRDAIWPYLTRQQMTLFPVPNCIRRKNVISKAKLEDRITDLLETGV